MVDNVCEATGIIVETVAGEVPIIGGPLEAFVRLFWPSDGENVWDQINVQVEQLIDEKISDLVYNLVSEDLDGLKSVSNDYLQAVHDSTSNPTFISEKCNVAIAAFEAAEPHFKSKGYEVLLLPLFAQMANLYIAILRDAVLHGKDWGWTDQILHDTRSKLTDLLERYAGWVSTWYQQGLSNVRLPTTGPHLSTLRWAATNKYVREMTLGANDFAQLWPYLDPTTYPSAVTPKLTREIYSDPQGSADDSTIGIDASAKPMISHLSIWGWDRIDAMQVHYGELVTPRMGDQSGGSNAAPHGADFDVLAGNPLVEAWGLSGDILNGAGFTFQNGAKTSQCGGNYQGGGPFSWKVPNHVLSSVKIMGVSRFYGSADCAVFGFRYPKSY